MNVKTMDEGGPGDGSHPLGFTSFTEKPRRKIEEHAKKAIISILSLK